MVPITGVAEKKAAEGAFNWLRKRLSPNVELQKALEAAKERIVALERRLDVQEQFERRKAELECLADDDCMYRRKDGKGPYLCPLCLDADGKFVPLPHSNSEGSYFCSLHTRHFETHDLRERRRFNSQQRAQRPSGGRHGWMR